MHEQFGWQEGDGTFPFRSSHSLGILNGGKLKEHWKTTRNTCWRNVTLLAFEADGYGSRRKVCRLCWLVAESVSCDTSRWVQITSSL